MAVVQFLDEAARKIAPAAMTILLVPVGLTPLHLPDYGHIAPTLSFIGVYYWALYRPDLMPAVVVFAIGLLEDLLRGTPVGTHAFVLLVVFGVTVWQRALVGSRSFAVQWGFFLVIAALAMVVRWLLMSLIHGTLISVTLAAFQILFTAALYPCVAWVFTRAQRAFLRPA